MSSRGGSQSTERLWRDRFTVAVASNKLTLKEQKTARNHNKSRPGKRAKRWRIMSEPTPIERPPKKHAGGMAKRQWWLVTFKDFAGAKQSKHIRARSIGEVSIRVREFMGAGSSILDIIHSPIGRPKND